ncbi:hypothetical protein BCV69DRAFT_313080 [Microstroma glucosiphilum]|uniref:Uncharacterized protein n=1 Tax=Pseudomicrostroma glucosiphilum TaxID=1684307 RepID=A0A316U5J6_9BASI|nr:hypothetical protein BCV69DRAFT_313080 [Pseudomicrostroma glucosiphilum]PWN20499.1 hypothetical protein BCV69DRAFT_313080 [Pseudomicrostroma glucosiphilum]
MSPCPCTPRSLLEPGGPRFLDPALRVSRQELDRQDRQWRGQSLLAATTDTTQVSSSKGSKGSSRDNGGAQRSSSAELEDPEGRASQETKVAGQEDRQQQQQHQQPVGPVVNGSKNLNMLTRWKKAIAS